MPSSAKEWDRGWGFKREEGDSWDNKKSRCLVIRCLPCLTDGSFR